MNIIFVVKSHLCTGCGTCVSLCPNQAINFYLSKSAGFYFPQVNQDKCIDCGICLIVCPGFRIDYDKLNQNIFGKSPDNTIIGNYLNCYTGHATNPEIWHNSTSGGLLTSMLIFALEHHIINGALVTRWTSENPLQPQSFIARTRDELLLARKSKYCPVSPNTILKDILESNANDKFAVVGLPCHIHGIRKAEQIEKRLSSKIILHFGLFCGASPSFKATKFLLKKAKVKEKDIYRLDYRVEWPGYTSITLNNGNIVNFPYQYIMSLCGTMFNNNRCNICCDGTNELSDVSFGDAWLPKYINEKTATSIIIGRTKIGNMLINLAKESKDIDISLATIQDVNESQISMLYMRKRLSKTYTNLYRRNDVNKGIKLQNPFIIDYFIAIYLNILRIFGTKPIMIILEHMPRFLTYFQGIPLAMRARYCYYMQTKQGLKYFVCYIKDRIKKY